MLKLVAFLQTVVIGAFIALTLVLTNGASNLRADLAALKEAEAKKASGATSDPAPSAALENRFDDVEKRFDRLEKRMSTLTEKTQDVLTSIEFLAVDLDGIKRNTWDTLQALQTGGDSPEPEMPEAYQQLFTSENREKLVDLAAAKGVTLKEDRVEVPAIIIQDRAMLEFFAVTTGGKEHEAIVALVGNHDPDSGRMPEGLPGMLNACILALGYEKGTPVQISRDGKVLPPEGDPIHVYLEWTGEDGEAVRARAEDLVYDLQTKKAMERDKWVFVGSRFERDWGSGKTVYMADLTGDIVATYSWPNTIIDNTTSEGSDDIYYACYTPRIPKIGTRATFVVSAKPLAAKDFPEEPPVEAGEDGEDGEDGSDK